MDRLVAFTIASCLTFGAHHVFACQPPPGELRIDAGFRSVAMPVNGAVLLPITRVYSPFDEMTVFGTDGVELSGSILEYDRGPSDFLEDATVDPFETQESKLVAWRPQEPLAIGTSLEVVLTTDTVEGPTTQAIPVTVVDEVPAEFGPVEPFAWNIGRVTETRIECMTFPDEPGRCSECESFMGREKTIVTAEFDLTESIRVARRIVDSTPQGEPVGENDWIWDIGVDGSASTVRFSSVAGCFVGQALDLFDATLVTGEPTCFDQDGNEVSPEFVIEAERERREQMNAPDPDADADPDVVEDGPQKPEPSSCATASSSSTSVFLALLLVLGWRRRQ